LLKLVEFVCRADCDGRTKVTQISANASKPPAIHDRLKMEHIEADCCRR
jgi:hypothetical protein